MSCFWDALIRELRPEEAQRAGVAGITDPSRFAAALQARARSVFVMVTWQGEHLTEQERRDHALSVSNYIPASVNDGYMCGSCDSFLLLVSHVAGVNIRLSLDGTLFEYASPLPSARWMGLVSSSSHMN
jgi:hypothetical protein